MNTAFFGGDTDDEPASEDSDQAEQEFQGEPNAFFGGDTDWDIPNTQPLEVDDEDPIL